MTFFTKKYEIPREPAVTEIHFEEGSFQKHLTLLSKEVVFALDEKIKPIYFKDLHEDSFFIFPSGEAAKLRQSKEAFENWLLQKGCGKEAVITACGGGSLLDAAAFTASTFCRGVRLILMPTTLLAMVDAGLGGKTAINLNEAKNYLGTTYFPEKIIIDPEFLHTLSEVELKSGFSEMIKHGAILNRPYFEFLFANHLELKNLKKKPLEEAILQSIAIKMEIISKDPYEKGKRALLNFGHTIGHALESVENYRLPHGQAVALGMAAESFLSYRAGLLKEAELDKMIDCLFLYHGQLSWPKSASDESIAKALLYDKKRRENNNFFVLIEEVGKPFIKNGKATHPLPKSKIQSSLEWMRKNF